ncbi:MAG: hypothetical protein ACXVEE_42040 [Polyangiales bacterium]
MTSILSRIFHPLCGLAWIAGCSSSAPEPNPGATTPAAEDVRILTGRTEADFCSYYHDKHIATAKTIQVGGSESSCDAGTLSADALADVRARVDWFRGLVGLPPVRAPLDEINRKAQSCAMMQAIHQKLSHEPTSDWTCFSDDGAYASAHSNLTLADKNPAESVDAFMFDWRNEASLGHRRWLLEPSLAGLGYGFFDAGGSGPYGERSATCLVVFDEEIPSTGATSEQPIAYPPPGAFPAAWLSFTEGSTPQMSPWAIMWKDADFRGATLTMRDPKTDLPIPTSTGGAFRQLPDGYGNNVAALWVPASPPPMGSSVEIRITGIKRKGVAEKPLVYTVDVVDCGVTFDP